jgi:ribitol 2-dehydrogenase
MKNDLNGKTALVTGASSGVGRALARLLASQGAKVALVARSTQKLRALELEIGDQAVAITADLTKSDQVDEMVARAVEHLGRIDILMANAGVFFNGAAVEEDPDAWDDLLAVNVNSVFRAIRRVLPHMIANRSGDIIVTSSIAGVRVMPNQPVYTASKHAVEAFVRSIAQQAATHNVRIGTISPGTILNELWGITDQDEIERRVAEHTGLRSEDVAEACLFMLNRPANVAIRNMVILPQAQEV